MSVCQHSSIAYCKRESVGVQWMMMSENAFERELYYFMMKVIDWEREARKGENTV